MIELNDLITYLAFPSMQIHQSDGDISDLTGRAQVTQTVVPWACRHRFSLLFFPLELHSHRPSPAPNRSPAFMRLP